MELMHSIRYEEEEFVLVHFHSSALSVVCFHVMAHIRGFVFFIFFSWSGTVLLTDCIVSQNSQ